MSALHARTEDPTRERGSVLIWALLFVVVTSSMVISHAVYLASTRRERDTRYSHEAVAMSFSRNGLEEVLAWFRRQPVQPVTSFQPLLDPTGDPPLFDTIDPTVGLVREFEVRGNLWGRYEVRLGEATDISEQRSQSMPGSVWEVGVRSFIYRILDPSRPFDEAPNRIIGTSNMMAELRPIPLTLPAPAAVNVDEPALLKVYPNGKIIGGSGGGIAYMDPMSMLTMPLVTSPDIDGAATVNGSPAQMAVPTYDATPETSFSMRLDEIKSFSDEVWQPGVAWRSTIGGDNDVVYVPGDLTIDADRSADGVLMIVDGDLDVIEGNDVTIDGVIYVGGDAFVRGNFTLNGAMIVRGFAHIGMGSLPVEINYDSAIIDALRLKLGRYRMRRTIVPGQ